MRNKVFLSVSAERNAGLQLEDLHNELNRIKAWGFDGAEIVLDTFPLIIAGRIIAPVLDYIRPIFLESGLTFSAHIASGLNMRTRDDLNMHRNVLLRSIDICSELNLNPLVLHFEQCSHDDEIEAQFIRCHKEAAIYAKLLGIDLALENIEVEDYKLVLNAIEEIDSSNFGMTLDMGHLYLSSKHRGFCFEQALSECAPYATHCHVNDNAGIFEPLRLTDVDAYRNIPQSYCNTFGRGDMHVPPLYGEVPISTGIYELEKAGFRGIYTCEYAGRQYSPFNFEICQSVKSLVDKAGRLSAYGMTSSAPAANAAHLRSAIA